MRTLVPASEVLEIALEIEKNGAAFYESLSKSTSNVMVKGAYHYLAEQERRHIQTFENLLDALPKDQPREAQGGERLAYVQALASEMVFTDDKVVEELAKRATNHAEAIHIGLGLEKDFILFLYEIRGLVHRADRKVIDGLIKEEKTHVSRLSELKKRLST